ncbi:uncharacterized protein LOC111347399 [Stylophora pistillata]|uniref:uncharacterized protein LOC111347399 n=1 Tax=Stylophora pistillata TaxID=50429 RepID=UPI000C0556E2|nr:uncharacterized protein LOC111347399 [Stylophora pistillata]
MEQQSRGNNTEEELMRVSLGRQKSPSGINKECYFCGGAFPHAGGKEKCPAWGKRCTTCGKLNHFAKCCRSKRKGNKSIVKTVHQEVHSGSSDAESLCVIEEVGAVESNPKPRPVRNIKIENREAKVLIDTGASVNVMDEGTFQQLLANKIKLEKSTSVLHSYQTNENPSRPLIVMGKLDAVVESNTRIIPATFHVIKGNTNTEPLIGFQTAESLGLVVITNAIRTDSEMFTSKLLEEYADVFLRIGKMEGVHREPLLITRDIPGCLNISDDILVYGKTQQEHDRNLDKLFKKAREKKITFNKGKCEFNKQSCVYYGMKLAKDGASPDQRKVEAINAAEPPRNAKQLNSFLCTVQYNTRLMEKYAPQTGLLRGLLKANVFAGTRDHQEAFEFERRP